MVPEGAPFPRLAGRATAARHRGLRRAVDGGAARPSGDRERAIALLDAARGPFESIGMPGWLRRAEELRQQLER